jgi:hypothetical protein
VCALPHSQFDRPVAFPDDGIGVKAKPLAPTRPDGFAILVRLLFEVSVAFPPPWSIEELS